MNLISNNRYFDNSIKTFFDKNPRIKENNSICDVDAIQQCPNSGNVNYINHITDYNIFGDKYRHYDLLLKKLGYRPNFILKTYLFNRNNVKKLGQVVKTKNIWIIKPQNDYGRHGVKIVRTLEDIINWIGNDEKHSDWILQEYVDKPLLINNKKFHFRIYCLICKTGNDIKLYAYKKGFIYSAGSDYNTDTIDDKIHLSGEDNKGRVTVFDNNHPLYPKIWNKVKNVLNMSVNPLYDEIICPNNKNCYKFLGFDILIDENYNLYLAEINARLISLKYPPAGFKEDLYNSILNTVYKNNPTNMDLLDKKNDYSSYIAFGILVIICAIIVIIVLMKYKSLKKK